MPRSMECENVISKMLLDRILNHSIFFLLLLYLLVIQRALSAHDLLLCWKFHSWKSWIAKEWKILSPQPDDCDCFERSRNRLESLDRHSGFILLFPFRWSIILMSFIGDSFRFLLLVRKPIVSLIVSFFSSRSSHKKIPFFSIFLRLQNILQIFFIQLTFIAKKTRGTAERMHVLNVGDSSWVSRTSEKAWEKVKKLFA